jgi:hypothetical protein
VPDPDTPRRKRPSPWVWAGFAGGLAVGALTAVLFTGGPGDRSADTMAAASSSALPGDRTPTKDPAGTGSPASDDYADLDDLGLDDNVGEPDLPEPPAEANGVSTVPAQQPAGGTESVAHRPVIDLPVLQEVELDLVDTTVETLTEPVTEALGDTVTPLLTTLSAPVPNTFDSSDTPEVLETVDLAPRSAPEAPAVPDAIKFALPHSSGGKCRPPATDPTPAVCVLDKEPTRDEPQEDSGPHAAEVSDVAVLYDGDVEVVPAGPEATVKPKKDGAKKNSGKKNAGKVEKKNTQKGDKPKGKSKADVAPPHDRDGYTWSVAPHSTERDVENVRPPVGRDGQRFVVTIDSHPESGQRYLGGHVATA